MGNICFHIVGKFDRLGFLFCYAGDTMIYLGLVLGLYHGAIPGTGVGVVRIMMELLMPYTGLPQN
jgi:hypothetical protein